MNNVYVRNDSSIEFKIRRNKLESEVTFYFRKNDITDKVLVVGLVNRIFGIKRCCSRSELSVVVCNSFIHSFINTNIIKSKVMYFVA